MGVLAVLAGVAAIADGLPTYADRRPQLGPGAYPTWVGIGLVVVGVALSLRALSQRSQESARSQPASRRANVITLSALTAYLVALPPVGFVLSTEGFLLVMLAAVGHYSVVRSALYATLLTVFIGYLFMVALPIGLPAGVLGF